MFLKIYIITSVTFFLYNISYSNYNKVKNINFNLISNYKVIKPGNYFWIGLKINIKKNWHIYWRNSGEGGKETKIKWNIPNKIKLIKTYWPIPQRLIVFGKTVYTYKNEIFILSKFYAEKNIEINQNIKLINNINWTICDDKICMPPTQNQLKINIKFNPKEQLSNWYNKITNLVDKLTIENKNINIKSTENEDNLFLYLEKNQNIKNINKNLEFLSLTKGLVYKNQKWIENNKGYLGIIKKTPKHKKTDLLNGIIVSKNNLQKLSLEVKTKIENNINNAEINKLINKNVNSNKINILLALFFAFLGGIILNLMPCVLPIISLKILNFIKQAENKKSEIIKHGLVYNLGVIVSFWIIALLIIFLRPKVEGIGWGFQLQSANFIIVISSVFFVISLNLLGVFEITANFRLKNSKNKNRFIKSFMTGVLSSIATTPCSAPILSSAIGFAFTQTDFKLFLIFNFIAIGVGFPYLLLSFFPKMLKVVPKPGEWMVILRQIMGFMLILFVIYLMWVLASQTNSDYIINMLVFFTFMSISFWIFGYKQYQKIKLKTLWFKRISYISMLIIAFYFIPISKANIEKIKWEKFSKKLINKIENSSERAFIDFTAKWCITCQSNKIFAINKEKVIKEFKKLKVRMIKADWTKKNIDITNELKRYQKAAVPFYVLYTGINNKKPEILPEILTENIILKYLKKIEKS